MADLMQPGIMFKLKSYDVPNNAYVVWDRGIFCTSATDLSTSDKGYWQVSEINSQGYGLQFTNKSTGGIFYSDGTQGLGHDAAVYADKLPYLLPPERHYWKTVVGPQGSQYANAFQLVNIKGVTLVNNNGALMAVDPDQLKINVTREGDTYLRRTYWTFEPEDLVFVSCKLDMSNIVRMDTKPLIVGSVSVPSDKKGTTVQMSITVSKQNTQTKSFTVEQGLEFSYGVEATAGGGAMPLSVTLKNQTTASFSTSEINSTEDSEGHEVTISVSFPPDSTATAANAIVSTGTTKVPFTLITRSPSTNTQFTSTGTWVGTTFWNLTLAYVG